MKSWMVVLAVIVLAEPAFADVTGPARVVDGDTIWIGKTKIRLFGIDAPETKQECQDANGNPWMTGQDATAFLKSLTEGKQVICSEHGKDKYGRVTVIAAMFFNAFEDVLFEEVG